MQEGLFSQALFFLMPAGLFKLVFRPLNPDAAEDKIWQYGNGSAPHAANTLASFKTDCKGAL